MANKQERLKSIIGKNIKEICEFELDRTNIDFFTITEVRVSDDHSYAKVMVSFFTNPEKNIEKLNNARGYVRTLLSKRIDTRRVPEIMFEIDDTYEKQKAIEDLLEKARNQGKKN